MGDRIRQFFHVLSCRKDYIVLLIFWLIGLLAGSLLATKTSSSYIDAIRLTAKNPVSIVSIFVTALLPALVCTYAAYSHKPGLIYLTCFLKTFIFSHGALTIFTAFGSAGWLVQPMVQFSEFLLLPLFCWFCMRNLKKSDGLFSDLGIYVCVSLAVCYLNFCFVSPFLAMIIEQ